MLTRKSQECWGCGDTFITFKNYDYCANCAVNNNRYLRPSNCSECDGSGIIKFRKQKPRPCKLCHLTKKSMPKKPLTKKTKLTPEEQFWTEVENKSKDLIANLIEKVLPIETTTQNFDCEKDVDYRVLLRDDLPQSYADNEEYQAKITKANWTAEDVEYVAQEVTVWYFSLVVKSLADWLSDYPSFDFTVLARLKENY